MVAELKVHVVTDDIDFFNSLKKILKNDVQLTQEVITTRSEIVEIIELLNADIICLDHNMSSEKPLDILVRIRQLNATIPIFVFSSSAFDEESVTFYTTYCINELSSKKYTPQLKIAFFREVNRIHSKISETISPFNSDFLTQSAVNNNDGIMVTDKYGITQWINPRFEQITGFNKEDIVGKKPSELLQGVGTNEETVRYIKKNLTNETPFSCEIKNYRKDGSDYWANLTIAPIYKDNELTNFIGFQKDLTAKSSLYKNISIQNELINSVANNLKAAITRYVLHKDGSDEVLFASKGVLDIYEITPETAKQNITLLWDMFHPDDNEKTRIAIQEGAKNETIIDEQFRIITPSGKLKWIHAISSPILAENGDIIWDTIALDITRDKNRLNTLVEISKIAKTGKWEYDLITNELTWSEMTKLIHEVEEEYSPTVEHTIHFYKQGYSRNKIKEVFEHLLKHQQPYIEDLELNTAKGNHKWVRAFGKCEVVNGKITRVYGLFQDITDYTLKKNEIKEALQEKDILLGEVNHRVKTNFAIITGIMQLQLMLEDKNNLVLRDAVNRVQSIASIHDMLYNSDSFNEININRYIARLINNIAGTYPELNDSIQVNLNIYDLTVHINQAVPLALLLNELITNSIKHAFMNTPNSTISIKLQPSTDSTLILSYSDNGVGYDMEKSKSKQTLGMELITSLLAQINSKFTMSGNNGFSLTAIFSNGKKSSKK